MADCAAVPSCARVLLQRNQYKTNLYIPQSVNARSSQRECLLIGKTYRRCQLPSLIVDVSAPSCMAVRGSPMVNIPSCIAVRGSQRVNKSSLRCCCLGTFMEPENIVPASWASYADEVLLVVSVIFAYMAGAIPQKRAVPSSGSNTTNQNNVASSPIPYGRTLGKDTESKSNDCWSEVEGKLFDALSTNEHDDGVSSKAEESENGGKMCPLSLFALAEGPRLRLLSATLQQLQKEVSGISLRHEIVNRDVWLGVASEVIKASIQPTFSKWLEEEAILETGDPDLKLINIISGKLKGDDTVLQSIVTSGKAELYADLLFLLRFGCLRTACYFDSKFLTQHGIDILEDVVIMLADGIARIYLEFISVDSNMFTEINAMGITLCSLSTRELQRMRNEVALKQWLLQNFESVVSMYEDRFELSVLCRQKHEDPLKSQSGKSTWWKKFSFRKSATPPSLNYVLISPIFLPVKRTKELRALTGWKYYFSLFLEFSDITMPLVKTVFTKVTNAVSFFLVYMVGRSLGLIFTGIRQSLGWR